MLKFESCPCELCFSRFQVKQKSYSLLSLFLKYEGDSTMRLDFDLKIVNYTAPFPPQTRSAGSFGWWNAVWSRFLALICKAKTICRPSTIASAASQGTLEGSSWSSAMSRRQLFQPASHPTLSAISLPIQSSRTTCHSHLLTAASDPFICSTHLLCMWCIIQQYAPQNVIASTRIANADHMNQAWSPPD